MTHYSRRKKASFKKRGVRKLKRFRNPVSASKEAGEGEAADKEGRKVAGKTATVVKKKRFSLSAWMFRLVVYPFIFVGFLILIGYGVIQSYVKTQDVVDMLSEFVANETGGKLEIDQLSFNVLSGLELVGVRFFPPMPRDFNQIDSEPLFSTKRLLLKYSLPRVLLGKLHINAISVESPEVSLKQTDGQFSYEGILAYRETLPSSSESAKQKDDESDSNIDTKLLVLPFELLAQNIGISELAFYLRQEESGHVRKVLATSGLNLSLGVEWLGSNGHLWTSVDSGFKRPFVLELVEQRDSGGLSESIKVQSEFKTKLDITDLKNLSFDIALSNTEISTPEIEIKDVNAFADLDLQLSSDLKALDVKSLVVHFGDVLRLRTRGAIDLPSVNRPQIELDLRNDLSVSLEELSKYSRLVLDPHQLGGAVEVTRLDIKGPVYLDQLEKNPMDIVSPFISSEILFHVIELKYPSLGVTVSGFSGQTKLSSGPDAAGAGSFLESDLSLTLAELLIAPNAATNNISSGVSNLALNSKSRFLLSSLSTPLSRLNLEIEKLRIQKPNSPQFELPFYLDMTADGNLYSKQVSFAMDSELGDLMNLSADLSCSDKCLKVRLDNDMRVAELARVHEILAPFAAALGAEQFFPAEASGAIDAEVQARGSFLHEPGSDQFGLSSIDRGFNLRGQFDVADVNLKLPIYSTELSGFELRGFANGDFTRQRINIATGFNRLQMSLTGLEEAAVAERLKIELKAANRLKDGFNLGNPLPDTESEVEVRLGVGKFVSRDFLPDPIRDFGALLRAEQSGVNWIRLNQMSVEAPQYGIKARLEGETKVNADYSPNSIRGQVSLQIDHNGQEKLPLGVDTSGMAAVRFGVESEDMKTASMDGELEFKKFSIKAPGELPGTWLAEIENLQGKLPLAQKLNIEKLLKPSPLALSKANGRADVEGGDSRLEVVDTDTAAQTELSLFRNKKERRAETSSSVASNVDYNTLRSFYPERFPISVERVSIANLELNRFELDIELKQNQFSINQFFVNFLGGRLQGSTQIDFDSAFLTSDEAIAGFASGATGGLMKSLLSRVNTSVHLTRLNTTKLIERIDHLKNTASKWGDPYIDGAMHLDFDVVSNDIQGGIEITSIGKEQLKMILYYVDPYEKNPTINDIRTALTLGDVKLVSIPIKNGEVGLDVDVRVFHAPIPTPKLSRFPITRIIESFETDAKKTSGTSSKPLEKDDAA